MNFEEFLIGKWDDSPSEQNSTAAFSLAPVAGRSSIPVTVRRFPTPREGGATDPWLQWHLYNLIQLGIPHVVFDFAQRKTPVDWPSLPYVPNKFGECVCTLDPFDKRIYQILSQGLPNEAAQFAQWIHAAEILIGSESGLWPDNPKAWFSGWRSSSFHELLHIYDPSYLRGALTHKWLGAEPDERLIERWQSFFTPNAVLGKMYSDPFFARTLKGSNPKTELNFYDQPFLFCCFDLSRLPLLDAKWMAEAVLIARIHHLQNSRIFHLQERHDRASSPNLDMSRGTVKMPLDSKWNSARITETDDGNIKTLRTCQDLHIVLIDHDIAIVDIRAILDHTLRTLVTEFRGSVFVYAQCGRHIPSPPIPAPPKNDLNTEHSIYQLSSLQFARDSELVEAELRLSASFTSEVGVEMPSSTLLRALVSLNQVGSSPGVAIIHEIRAKRNLQFDWIGEAHNFPWGALEDARFYLPEVSSYIDNDTPIIPLSGYHDLTEVIRCHKLVVPAPPAPETKPKELTPTSPTVRTKPQERPASRTSADPNPWIPGKVLKGVADIRHHQVPEESAFILNDESLTFDERRLRSLDDLSEAINLIDPETFQHHVNEDKNDFATWVEHVFDENALGEQLRKFPTPLRMMVSIEKFIRSSN